MAKAKKADLTDLHARLAAVLTEALEGTQGEDEGGNPVTVPPNAAILNVARQFLRDNNITADLATNPGLSRLKKTLDELPAFDDDDADGAGYPRQ